MKSRSVLMTGYVLFYLSSLQPAILGCVIDLSTLSKTCVETSAHMRISMAETNDLILTRALDRGSGLPRRSW